ncbi:MAG: calcium/sodium antiporter [Bacteroidales bacterium]|nr:calcium/sodium antiporter [Bacteroidales bacterium]
MLTDILLLLLGLSLIVLGAEWLVDGASAIARKLNVSEFVIGLTIVGFGTSCPELVVSLTGAFAGNSDISIGNVLGSNIFNTLLILGTTALISPIAITAANRKRDIPVTLLVTVLLIVCGMSHTLFKLGPEDNLTRIEGVVFLILFAIYIYSCFKTDKGAVQEDEPAKERTAPVAAVLTLLGLAGLVAGGHWFVNSAVRIASALGVSDKFIAITLLAGGTSLPELAACIVAAARKKGQLALGNILGSNIFNILLILGAAATVSPISLGRISLVDVGTVLLSVILVMLSSFTFKKNEIDRWEGALFVAAFTAYYVWLFINL